MAILLNLVKSLRHTTLEWPPSDFQESNQVEYKFSQTALITGQDTYLRLSGQLATKINFVS